MYIPARIREMRTALLCSLLTLIFSSFFIDTSLSILSIRCPSSSVNCSSDGTRTSTFCTVGLCVGHSACCEGESTLEDAAMGSIDSERVGSREVLPVAISSKLLSWARSTSEGAVSVSACRTSWYSLGRWQSWQSRGRQILGRKASHWLDMIDFQWCEVDLNYQVQLPIVLQGRYETSRITPLLSLSLSLSHSLTHSRI